MRRFVAIFLLMLLPLQAIWAAAAPYCQHENEQPGSAAGHHIGHHQPDHGHAHGHDDAGDGHDTGASADHGDCHVCHGGAMLPHTAHATLAAAPSPAPGPLAAHSLRAPPTERPERPNWPALA